MRSRLSFELDIYNTRVSSSGPYFSNLVNFFNFNNLFSNLNQCRGRGGGRNCQRNNVLDEKWFCQKPQPNRKNEITWSTTNPNKIEDVRDQGV